AIVDAGTLWIDAPGSVEIELSGELSAGSESLFARLERPGSQPISLERDGSTLRASDVATGKWKVVGSAPGWFLVPLEIVVAPTPSTHGTCHCERALSVVVSVHFDSLLDDERLFDLVVERADGNAWLVEETHPVHPSGLDLRKRPPVVEWPDPHDHELEL